MVHCVKQQNSHGHAATESKMECCGPHFVICDGCFKAADLLRVNNLVLIMGFYSGTCLPQSDGVASVVACPLGLGSSYWTSLPASQFV